LNEFFINVLIFYGADLK